MNDLILNDSTYLDRLYIRRKLIAERFPDVIAANPIAQPAVAELYEWLFQIYLPRRFPTMFTLDAPHHLTNLVTNESIPLTPPPDATEALVTIGSHIDTDFLILLPSPNASNPAEPKSVLEAFITCFPSGFSTRAKLGLKLADIHAPVPHYKQRLERSMDRFFATLPVGKIVRRTNWAVTTTTDLFMEVGTHLHLPDSDAARDADGAETAAAGEAKPRYEEEEVDIDSTVLRTERQTLHRLPKTGALVFGFKTYQYPIREIKEEGLGEVLAEAAEGLGKGNAPDMRVYKKGVVWGKSVCRFLRS